MRTSYDPATDLLYIHFADHASVDSVELTDGLMVDYGLDGVAVGHRHAKSQPGDWTQERGSEMQLRRERSTLHIRLTDKPVTRETSPNWHTNISYAEDGSIVEVVLLDFSTLGKLNLQLVKASER